MVGQLSSEQEPMKMGKEEGIAGDERWKKGKRMKRRDMNEVGGEA